MHKMPAIQNSPIQQAATVALSLQQTLIPQLEVSASNLSNGNTSGFKRAMFNARSVLQKNADGSQTSYAQNAPIKRDFRDGSYRQTENTFDLAISGEGFFRLQNNQLTRNGQFTINKEGKLVNGSGLAVQGDGGEVTIPLEAKFVHISSEGTISTEKGVLGKIGVFTVSDPNTLTYGADGNYMATGEVSTIAVPHVLQGFVEESNVNPIDETIKLIEIMRLFEYAQKLMDDQAKRTSQLLNMSIQNAA